MRLKLLILALFPIMLFGQANLKLVRSNDSTFTITNQESPEDTIWKFTPDYLIRYESNAPTDTLGIGGGGVDSVAQTYTADTFKLNNSDYFMSAFDSESMIITDDIDDFNAYLYLENTSVGKTTAFLGTEYTGFSVETESDGTGVIGFDVAGYDLIIINDSIFGDGSNNSDPFAGLFKYLESEVSKADTLIGTAALLDTLFIYDDEDLVGRLSNSGFDAMELVSESGIILGVESGGALSLSNNVDGLNTILHSGDTIFIDGTGSSTSNNIKVKTLTALDSIFVGDGWITGVDTSNTFSIDSIETNNLTIGGGTTITGDTTSKYVMENTNPDSVQISNYTIRFNESEGVHEFFTGIDGVIWQGALEDLFQFYNNTGQTIDNFTPLYYSGINGDSILTCDYATAAIEFTVLRYAGMSTGSVPDGTWGFGNRRGKIRDANTSSLSQIGSVFLGADSLPTMTKPAYPNEVLVLGGVIKVGTTDGIFYHDPSLALRRELESRDYSFTTQGILSGTYYKGGYYDWSATDANLTQASTTQTYGSANIAYAAHASVVVGGAGSTDAGVVGLRVTGTSIDDNGVRTASDADTIITDITAVATDEYYESKKWIGTVTYELITISGSPTTYSLDFNYGFAKYEDTNNNDYYIIGVECVGLAGANDTDFNIELLHHKSTDWTYAATGFIPGDGAIASWSTDMSPEDNLSSGVNFAWKRSNLNQFIDGNGSEGGIFRITTGASASVQSMDLHILIALDN